MIAVEIELKSPDARNDIYALKQYLQEHVEGLQIHIKEQPVPQGQMSIGLVSTLLTLVPEPVLKGSMEVVTKIAIESIYEKILRPIYNKWIGDKAVPGSSLEILSTLSDRDSKIHFLEDSSGKSQVFTNKRYAIDTDKTRALLIGVGQFDSNFPSIPPVKGNLEDLYQLLVDKRHIGLPRENITVSYNETQKEIIRHLLQASRIEDTHTLLIYFVGHGYRTDIKKLALIARDSEKIDDEILSGIDFDFISSKIMKSSTARQKILILDACHSGIATQGDDDMILATDVMGSYILASSPGDEVSYFDKGGQNTYFTGALIDVLRNGIDSASEMLALEDIYDYARDHLVEKNFPHPITKNELNIPASNFFIARNPLFTPEKIKLGARKLLEERKLEEALDAYRQLIRKYPDDMLLRKEFEECEMELSFTRLVEEANRNYYQYQNYAAALESYRKASRLKYDSGVTEKIRDCETRLKPVETDPLLELRTDPSYKEYTKCVAQQDDASARYILGLLQKKFPLNAFVMDQVKLLEKKTPPAPPPPSTAARVNEFNRLLKGGQPEQALQYANQQAGLYANETVWPSLKQKAQEAIGKKQQPPASRSAKRIMQIVSLVISATAAFFWFKSSKHGAELDGLSFKQMYAMMSADSAKTFPLLQEAEKDNDSISLLLGYYFWNKKDYDQAKTYFEKIPKLPRANTQLGRMYYFNNLQDDAKHTKAVEYFKQADALGADTLAWYFLGTIALDQYEGELSDTGNIFHSTRLSEQYYADGLSWFQKGSSQSVKCAAGEAFLYYKKARVIFNRNTEYRNAMSFMDMAAAIYLTNPWFQHDGDTRSDSAIADLGYMYNDSTGRPDQSRKLLQMSVSKGNLRSMVRLAAMYLRSEGGAYDCSEAFDLLNKARNTDSNYAAVYSNLGYIYEHGCANKIDKNLEVAKAFYRSGASRGNEYCQKQLKRLK